MTNFTEQSVFTEGVRMIEPGDSVIGGVNAPINLPFQALANRTLYLKTELAKAVQSIGGLQAITIGAGAGLTGGGSLAANRSLALATPSTLSGSTANWAGSGGTGHTHELAKRHRHPRRRGQTHRQPHSRRARRRPVGRAGQRAEKSQ